MNRRNFLKALGAVTAAVGFGKVEAEPVAAAVEQDTLELSETWTLEDWPSGKIEWVEHCEPMPIGTMHYDLNTMKMRVWTGKGWVNS